MAVYYGPIAYTEPHKHHAIQFVFSLNNPFEIKVENQVLKLNSIVINKDVEHQFFGKEEFFLFFFVEAESNFGRQLKQKLSNNYHSWDKEDPFYMNLKNKIKLNDLSIQRIKEFIFKELKLDTIRSNTDKRVTELLLEIDIMEEKKISVSELALSVNLSVSRLQHLFKQQTGISIKRYILWKRMIDGIKFATQGYDLTESAHEANFSDSAHMCRTFKEMFGINLSKIFRDSRFIQLKIENLV